MKINQELFKWKVNKNFSFDIDGITFSKGIISEVELIKTLLSTNKEIYTIKLFIGNIEIAEINSKDNVFIFENEKGEIISVSMKGDV